MRQALFSFSVSDMVRMIDDGVIGLPDFQRDFVWPPSQVAALLDSVGRGWPIGTLLLVPPVPELAMRPIDGAPSLRSDRVRYLVLDGQQRLTALYRAVSGVGEYDFNVSKERQDEKDQLFDWNPQSSNRETLDRRTLHRLTTYEVPCVVLGQDMRVYELAQIFEAINTPGVPIDVFDLANARVGAIGEDLRGPWEQNRATQPILQEFRVSALEVLRLVALKSSLEGANLRGLRASDLLDLRPDYIASSWSTAIDEYTNALMLLVDQAGVVEPTDVPSGKATLIVAATLSRFGSRRALERYWNTVLSPHELSDKDVTRAISVDDKLSTSESIRLADASMSRFTRGGNRMLSKALRGLARLNDARDPIDGESLANREIREFGYQPNLGITGRAVAMTQLDRTIFLSSDSAVAIRRDLADARILPDFSLQISALESQGFAPNSARAEQREEKMLQWVRSVVSEIL
ncbi:DUF262 domain-containing protein [Curtobacterium flaccumfaciens pv. flaccumfaciens]|uniref:DUF262 domain-containing protein n=1 Tax=Curtobacterium flaccumfaciens TaxID=2035 RepID=UPI003996A837